MRIGELAALAGVRVSTIRYYERRGLLPDRWRGHAQRRYDPGALHRLRFVRLAQAAGLTLSEIRHLLEGFPTPTPPRVRWRSITRAKLHEIDERIERLVLARRILRASTTCRCRDLDDCGRNARVQLL